MKIFDLTHTLTNDMPVYSKPNGPNIKKANGSPVRAIAIV